MRKTIEKIKKFAKDEKTLEILEMTARIGAIVFIGIAAPNAAAQLLKMFGLVPDYQNEYRTKRLLSSLQEKNFIHFWFKDGQGKMKLTPEGELHLANLQARKIKLPRKASWDGFWRIITFDIPEKLKANRRRFTRTAAFIGMHNLEKSMFVYPHECEEQILKIARLYKVDRFVRYIVANKIEPGSALQRIFPYTRLKKTRK